MVFVRAGLRAIVDIKIPRGRPVTDDRATPYSACFRPRTLVALSRN